VANGVMCKGATVGTSPASFESSVCEVSVDLETGKAKVGKFTDFHDCGTPISSRVMQRVPDVTTVTDFPMRSVVKSSRRRTETAKGRSCRGCRERKKERPAALPQDPNRGST
jgi:hypothetical protein